MTEPQSDLMKSDEISLLDLLPVVAENARPWWTTGLWLYLRTAWVQKPFGVG